MLISNKNCLKKLFGTDTHPDVDQVKYSHEKAGATIMANTSMYIYVKSEEAN